MRDRNLPYSQFYIELEEHISLSLKRLSSRRNNFSQELSFEFRPEELHSGPVINLPMNFRLLRTLAIIHWWLPKTYGMLVHLEMENSTFSWLNQNQVIELNLYLDSKETVVKFLYLTSQYTGNQIYGNFLGNDLEALSRHRILRRERYPAPRKKVFRRGPKDKGSRRLVSKGSYYETDVRSDVFLRQEEMKIERKKTILHCTINRILSILRLSDLEE